MPRVCPTIPEVCLGMPAIDGAAAGGHLSPMTRAILALALAAALPLPVLAQEAPEGGAWTDCQVSAISVYRDRVEVGCAGGALKSVVVETSDPLADMLLRLAIEAKGRTRPLAVLYVKSEAANPAGCSAETCRRVVGATLK